jgi:hypothetical protein
LTFVININDIYNASGERLQTSGIVSPVQEVRQINPGGIARDEAATFCNI